ncbi:MAG: transporter, partial [Trueperaceae bacterium]
MRAAHDPALDGRRERTLALAVALSAWGPFATAIAVVLAQSTTQVADFVRRTVELVAMTLAWATARRLRRNPDVAPAVAARWTRSTAIAVALALAVSGVATAVGLVVGARWTPGGDVRLGLAIATLGLLVNGGFWMRYRALGRARVDPIVEGQLRLYGAKVVV